MPEVGFDALARPGTAVEPANEQLILPREVRLHIVRTQPGQSDDPVGQLHFMHPAILDPGATSHHRIPRDVTQSQVAKCDALVVAY